MNVYKNCPVFENEDFCLRLVKMSNAEDLLKVYSDEKSVPFFNSDNCNGDDFHYTTLERMQQALEFWVFSYDNGYFVRWAIVDKHSETAIGTIELFHRDATDYFDDCGVLRLDLRSDYEQEEAIRNILSLILPSAAELFYCKAVVTKAFPQAKERITALSSLGFVTTEEKLIGGDARREYGDYMIKYCDDISIDCAKSER